LEVSLSLALGSSVYFEYAGWLGQALVIHMLCVINLCDAHRNLNVVEIVTHINSD
jgi:hypothetical protein